jgi:hypothetical protein
MTALSPSFLSMPLKYTQALWSWRMLCLSVVLALGVGGMFPMVEAHEHQGPFWSQHLTLHPSVNCAPVTLAMALSRLYPSLIPDNYQPSPPPELITSLQGLLHTSTMAGTSAKDIPKGLKLWARQHHVPLHVRYIGWHGQTHAPLNVSFIQALQRLSHNAPAHGAMPSPHTKKAITQIGVAHIGWYVVSSDSPEALRLRRVGGHYALIHTVKLTPEGLTLQLIDPMNRPRVVSEDSSTPRVASAMASPPVALTQGEAPATHWLYPQPLSVSFQFLKIAHLTTLSNYRLDLSQQSQDTKAFVAQGIYSPKIPPFTLHLEEPSGQFLSFQASVVPSHHETIASGITSRASSSMLWRGLFVAPQPFPYKATHTIPILEGVLLLKRP